MTRHATTQHVAEGLARAVLPAVLVADELPPFAGWPDLQCITWESMSGVPGLHLPTRNPVIRYSFWASTLTPGSGPAPWLKAEDLANALEGALQAPMVRGLVLTSDRYLPAKIVTAYPTTEPARIRNDPSGYARVDMSVLVKWVEVPA